MMMVDENQSGLVSEIVVVLIKLLGYGYHGVVLYCASRRRSVLAMERIASCGNTCKTHGHYCWTALRADDVFGQRSVSCAKSFYYAIALEAEIPTSRKDQHSTSSQHADNTLPPPAPNVTNLISMRDITNDQESYFGGGTVRKTAAKTLARSFLHKSYLRLIIILKKNYTTCTAASGGLYSALLSLLQGGCFSRRAGDAWKMGSPLKTIVKVPIDLSPDPRYQLCESQSSYLENCHHSHMPANPNVAPDRRQPVYTGETRGDILPRECTNE
ncbi:unnamed protein product [Trichogramma brassicae]|uniref:Uncharacterized protein n=1 Tax=Trichogramma brassicae TaxID=86971 RepID=A0A6H5IBB7_9HYME|nr:unnamed protein product [Trichogramma brassicae]